ncbi:MAG: Slp family lipoprotein [Gammaproteobacteria bacterium]|nr:Slp family lipoprotein [Gammaproteobacteria bacterium]
MDLKMSQQLKLLVKSLALLFSPLIFSACAIVPDTIQSENVAEINPIMVRGHIDSYKGQTIRWGGVITQVVNNADGTWVEVLAMNLSSSGRPTGDRDENFGRFIAKIDEFYDPEVYQEGYSFTVLGILTEAIDGKIGEYKYNFPVVTVQGSYLWPVRSHRYYYTPVIPGYWYYGHHPYWRFGYGYYGYGVRFNHNYYYPYYPIYGHLERNVDPLTLTPVRRPGTFNPDERNWPINANEDIKILKRGNNLTASQYQGTNGVVLGHPRSNNRSSVSNSSNRSSQSARKNTRRNSTSSTPSRKRPKSGNREK